MDRHSTQKIEDGHTTARIVVLGVLGATLALYLANPRGFTRGCMTVYNTGVQTGTD